MKKLLIILIGLFVFHSCENKVSKTTTKEVIYINEKLISTTKEKVSLRDMFFNLYIKETENFMHYYEMSINLMIVDNFDLSEDYIYKMKLSTKKSKLYFSKYQEYRTIEFDEIISKIKN